ncbi:MAG: LacI family DNA-binding transcriptional regulator [Luteitalea sp.]|nr:LacI family DNA-binding transcriptional regulator [Luteitalea sp.]
MKIFLTRWERIDNHNATRQGSTMTTLGKVRLQDVARTAGVSASTVSRIINGTGRVSTEIEQRVYQTAERLGFDLRRRKKPRLIAFLLGNRHLLHPFHSRILAGVEAYCAERGYHVLFLSLHYPLRVGWQDLQVPHIVQRRDIVDGFILAGAHAQNLLDLITRTKLPFALQANSVLRGWREADYDAVYYDDIDGSYQMTRYLQALGHRDIWFVGNRQFPWFDRCYDGYARAMSEAKTAPRSAGPDLDQPREAGYLGAKAILAQGASVTAIFAGSDATAQGVCEALRDSGLRVPDDVSVAGLDDIEARTMHPRLTTVHVYLEQVGRQLAELVIARIGAPGLPPRHVLVPTSLVKAESCRAPAADRLGDKPARSPSALVGR